MSYVYKKISEKKNINCDRKCEHNTIFRDAIKICKCFVVTQFMYPKS